MKHIRNTIFLTAMIFLFSSCSSDTTDKGPGNSTTSGSYVTESSDSTNILDTVRPAQPNGMDTTGEQTGRMNNTASGNSQPKNDSSQVKK